ncbi:MAG: hypothetical protein F4Z14_02980 [Gammaproteobacteria bacterium]|nr:hypothetical protein [Gammaproteobacteria bacterium]
MKITIFAMMLVLFGGHGFTEENSEENRTEFETYVWLEQEAMTDEEITNSEIHELIAQGLQHKDPEIVQLCLNTVLWHSLVAQKAIEDGLAPTMNRNLQDIPGLYDALIKYWNKEWERAGKVIPDPEDMFDPDQKALVSDMDATAAQELVQNIIDGKTSLTSMYQLWPGIPKLLAQLFPKKEEVYEIIWDTWGVQAQGYRGGLPDETGQNNPYPLLAALFHGKFNNPQDQEFRIRILLNEGSNKLTLKLAARSLGDLQSENGFEALVDVLQDDSRAKDAPHLEIVEAMLKYGEQAVPYVDLMRSRVSQTNFLNSTDRKLRTNLTEQLTSFEQKHVEEIEQPSQ